MYKKLICILIMMLVLLSGLSVSKDFTSSVPKYKFGDTLEEQVQQLQKNPMIKRFKKKKKVI